MSATILAFDTSGPYCAVALIHRGSELARCENMARGQAERLIGLLEECLNVAGLKWQDLSALGVGVGPGNFTGVRISIAAARGLCLGLAIPAYGVNGFEQRAHLSGLATVPATGDRLYVDGPDGLRLMSRAEAEALGQPLTQDTAPEDRVLTIARITQARWPNAAEPPAPLYIRPPDAAPPREAPPVILDA